MCAPKPSGPASLTRDAFQKAVQNADTEFAFNSENTE